MEALGSLVNQTLNRNLWEALLVSNYMDEEVNQFCMSEHFIHIHTDEKSWSSKVLIGLQMANGRIISFLEDDDIFLPNKLEKVLNAFEETVDLTFFHDTHQKIDSNGNPLLIVSKDHPLETTLTLEVDNVTPSSIRMIFRNHLFGPNSSNSILKAALVGSTEYLKRLAVGSDYFILVAALRYAGILAFDIELLTKYRIHNLSSTNYGLESSEALEKTALNAVIDHSVGFDMVRGKAFDRVIMNHVFSSKLLFDILSRESRKSIVSDFVGYLKSDGLRNIAHSGLIFPLILTFILSKSLARKIYLLQRFRFLRQNHYLGD